MKPMNVPSPGANDPACLDDEVLLAAWRSPRSLNDRDIERLETLVTDTVAICRAGWLGPSSPATAVGAAIALLTTGQTRGPALDVVMSTLLVLADRNHAAAVVLDHARRRLEG